MITSLLTYNDMMDHCFMFHLHISFRDTNYFRANEPKAKGFEQTGR